MDSSQQKITRSQIRHMTRSRSLSANCRMTDSITDAGLDGHSSAHEGSFLADGKKTELRIAGEKRSPVRDDESSHDESLAPCDIGVDKIEEIVPEYELDIEVGKVGYFHAVFSLGRSCISSPGRSLESSGSTGRSLGSLVLQNQDAAAFQRTKSRSSVNSKVSGVLSFTSRRKTRERIPWTPIPTSNLRDGIVGWDSQDDPDMPLNFPRRKKLLLVGLVSSITFVTPFASSILSPGIAHLDEDFGNSNDTVGALTVSIYLLGYVIGPLFLAPLCEIYGRKPVLGAANVFFCIWQIGCALAPNIESLIVFRLFSGIGGAGCLVSFLRYAHHLRTNYLPPSKHG